MNHRQFEQFADVLTEPTLLLRRDGSILVANAAAESLLGRPRADLHGRAIFEFLAGSAERFARYLGACARSVNPLPGVLTLARPGDAADGHKGGSEEEDEDAAMRCDGAAVRNSDDGSGLIVLRCRDRADAAGRFRVLTERIAALQREILRRRTAEEALAAEREWLSVTLASIGDAVIATDTGERVAFMNPIAEGLTGWKAADAMGRPIADVFDIINAESRRPVESPTTRVLREGIVVGLANHTLLIRRDGAETPIDDSGAPIRLPGGGLRGAVLVFRDISERYRSEAELREREALFRTMADAAPVLIWLADTSKGCTFFNKTWLEFTGRTMEQEVGNGWTEGVHPDDLARCMETYTSAFDARTPFQMEYRLRAADGSYRWVLDHGLPRFAPGESGDGFAGYIGSCTDITDRRMAEETLARHRDTLAELVEARTRELEQSHQRLRMVERMAAVGTLSAGLGHDMGNLLLPVRLRLDALEERPLDAESQEDLRSIRKCVDYLQRLSSGLRLLSMNPGEARGVGAETDLHNWWGDVERIYRGTLPRGVSLECHLPEAPLRVHLARHLLTQAVFNLVQNAGQAMADRGWGTVRLWAELASDRRHVRLGVSDDGPGMTEEVRRRCLEPFFTTRTRAISTGLGLSLVQGILHGVGGTIEIDTLPGRGTTFVLVLPGSNGSLPPSPESSPAPESRRKPVALLTVADPRTRALVRSILESAGFSLPLSAPDSPPTPPSPTPTTPTTPLLWVTDDATQEQVLGFLRADPRGHVVHLAANPPTLHPDAAPSDRERLITDLAGLPRAALGRTFATLLPRLLLALSSPSSSQ